MIQVFPSPKSILRLMEAVAIEQNDRLSSMKRALGKRIYLQLKAEIFHKMRELAKCQQSLLDAT